MCGFFRNRVNISAEVGHFAEVRNQPYDNSANNRNNDNGTSTDGLSRSQATAGDRQLNNNNEHVFFPKNRRFSSYVPGIPHIFPVCLWIFLRNFCAAIYFRTFCEIVPRIPCVFSHFEPKSPREDKTSCSSWFHSLPGL